MGVRRLRTMAGHRARVGVMAWSSHMLSSGSRDRNILQRDIRAPEDFQSKLLGHRSEVHARISMELMHAAASGAAELECDFRRHLCSA